MSLTDALTAFFASAELSYEPVEGQLDVFRTPFTGANGSWDVFAAIREEQGQILFYSSFPMEAPVEVRWEAMLFITRLNYGLAVGNFEMDLDDGEIRFRTTCLGADPSEALLADTLMANVSLMDAFAPALAAIVDGEITAADAWAEMEAAEEGEPG